MTLSYVDLMATERTRIEATITTDHPASHYGAPVIVLPDGDSLDYQSAMFLDYRVESATEAEKKLLEEWRRWMPPIENPAATLGRKGGQATGGNKPAAAKARNAKRKAEGKPEGGRPRELKWYGVSGLGHKTARGYATSQEAVEAMTRHEKRYMGELKANGPLPQIRAVLE